MKIRPKLAMPILFAAFAVMVAVCFMIGRTGGDIEPDGDARLVSLARNRPRLGSPLRGIGSAQGGGPGAPATGRAVPTSGPSDPAMASVRREMDFSDQVFAMAENAGAATAAKARALLRSKSAMERAAGGALLLVSGEMTAADMTAIADDESLLVPFVVGDWMGDFGGHDDHSAFLALLRKRKIPSADIAAFLSSGATMPGGGRTALDIAIPRMEDDGKLSDALESAVLSRGAAYDVREQLLLKFLEPETRERGIALVGEVAEKYGGASESMARMADRLLGLAALPSEATEDDGGDAGLEGEHDGGGDGDEADGPDAIDYKVWDTPVRDVAFLAGADTAFAVRSMANYLSYGLRRDDPDFEPVVEEGAYRLVRAFYERALAGQEALAAEERFVLDRLAGDIDRLALYDPEFAPDDEIDDGEEIPVGELDEEDAYMAALIAEEEGDETDEDGTEVDDVEPDIEEEAPDADDDPEDVEDVEVEEETGNGDDGDTSDEEDAGEAGEFEDEPDEENDANEFDEEPEDVEDDSP